RENEVAAVLAYHYRMAEKWVEAVEYFVRSGERARELFANPDALRHYSEALSLLKLLEETDASQSRLAEITALEGLAEVHTRLGDYTAAVASFGRALECAYLMECDEAERWLRSASIKRRMARCLFETGAAQRADELLRQAHRMLRPYQSGEVNRE